MLSGKCTHFPVHAETMPNLDMVNYSNDFDNIIAIIEKSKMRAIRAVNAEMIEKYWQIGRYLSEKSNNDGWGKNTVQDFADHLKRTYPSASGFSAQNLWRMKQFYETYRDNAKLSPLVREISWSNNLLIMTGCKTDESREFFMHLCIQNGYAKRELERQIDSMLYERTMLSQEKNTLNTHHRLSGLYMKTAQVVPAPVSLKIIKEQKTLLSLPGLKSTPQKAASSRIFQVILKCPASNGADF